jgi:hypothetical protein
VWFAYVQLDTGGLKKFPAFCMEYSGEKGGLPGQPTGHNGFEALLISWLKDFLFKP